MEDQGANETTVFEYFPRLRYCPEVEARGK
jgi:hypothetical protein